MPYFGLLDGEKVIPPLVSDDVTVICPRCNGEMSVVQSYTRGGAFVSRHFRHHTQDQQSTFNPEDGQSTFDAFGEGRDCPGESDAHQKMKSISYSRLEHEFPTATVEFESRVDKRIADVLVTFDDPRVPYGKGIAVEVQYRHADKDVGAVTADYLEQGYSVVWLHEDDFSSHDVDISGILTVWPYALPDRSGTEGYPDVIQWLWQDKSAAVEREIPIPGEFWASFDKSGEWVTIAQRSLRARRGAWATISRSPTGQLTFQVGKKQRRYGGETERVTVQLERADCTPLQEFADTMEQDVFGTEHPSSDEREEEWYDLTTAWLSGSPNVTAWLSASLSPDDDVVLSLGKKHPVETERITVQVDRTAVEAMEALGKLVEEAFNREGVTDT